jgi:two-component system, NarL family, response regulator NreC
MVSDPAVIASLFAAGANGYVVKTQPPLDIIGAIRTVQQEQRYLPPSVSQCEIVLAQREQPLRQFDRLTKREREVFELMVRGMSHFEVAQLLHISRRTAETHRQHIVRKLGAGSMDEAIRLGALYCALDQTRARAARGRLSAMFPIARAR